MRLILCFVLSVFAFNRTAAAYDSLYVRTFPAQGSLRLEIKDEIASPIYSWPRTLVTYPVDFSQAKVRADQLSLQNGSSSESEPFQLSGLKTANDGTLLFAQVSFFSDLPPGADRIFVLGLAAPEKQAVAMPETTHDGVLEVDAGTLQVRLPTSISQASATGFPSPIVGLNAGSGWCGGGQIVSPAVPVTSLDTECTESGPLFRTYVLTYHFKNGGTYVAIVRIVAGYPFVDLAESMSGLSPADGATMELNWEGFSPTKRQPATNWPFPPGGFDIDKPILTDGIIEEPHWWPADRIEDPAKEMIFRLAAFQGNATRDAVPAISFWEEGPGGRELGVFVPDAKKWNDHQYMIWQPTTLLQVRFRHADGRLIWTYPLVEGTRETGITLDSTDQTQATLTAFRDSYAEAAGKTKGAFVGNGSVDFSTFSMRYALWVRSWYGGLSLDKVKDWVLTRAEGEIAPSGPVADGVSDPRAKINSASTLSDAILHSSLMTYPLGLNVGIDAIGHRNIRPFVQDYLQYGAQFTPEERRRVDAVLLLSAYVNSGDDLAPSRSCLSGTPNISADGFSVPAELGILFPKHPLFNEWADQFEKRLQLMGCFYTRPDVPIYDSLGGRWCESLSEYNWAYFSPIEMGQTSLVLADGKNRMANAWMALRAHWLVGELSAPVYNPNPYWRQSLLGFTAAEAQPPPNPWHPGIDLTSQNGFERQFPSHGAHGSGTGIPVPNQVPLLAETLTRYDPIVAEHLFWATAQRTSDEKAEGDPYWQAAALKRIPKNTGTNPHLQSAKYTGHGIILRAGVDTPEELSIHLDQIDAGPDYRWGNNGEGSSGVLYFFAGGQPWAGQERENTGDHTIDDASGFTTFGVAKNGELRSIGGNVLDYPLYDLGSSQFGEITARKDLKPYSYPAYRSRSIMLVGTDYFILCDDAQGDNRFSWFTMKDLPYPKLVFLKPINVRGDHWSEVTTQISKGFIRDAGGSSIVLVSHKKNDVEMEKMTSKLVPYLTVADVRQYAWALPKGTDMVNGVYWVKTPTSHDIVFRDVEPISYQQSDATFSGTAGVVRNRTDGSTELALFEGTQIGAQGVTLQTEPGSDLGVSAVFKGAGPLAGFFFAPKASKLTITGPQTSGTTFYIDGAKQEATTQGQALTVEVPAGRHAWELTNSLPVPVSPVIVGTEDRSAGTSVVFKPVAGADHYRWETSADGGVTWRPGGQGAASPMALTGLTNGEKIHVRVIAANAQKESAPSPEYPVYVTDKPPVPPDGLDLVLQKDRIDLTWGEILGASEYRLYRRHVGDTTWTKIYAGLDRAYADGDAKGAMPPVELPGRVDNALADAGLVYEYAVAAVNGNGEGEKSAVANSDPTGWRNWWPTGQERIFKRQTGYWLPPYVDPEATPPLRYPQ